MLDGEAVVNQQDEDQAVGDQTQLRETEDRQRRRQLPQLAKVGVLVLVVGLGALGFYVAGRSDGQSATSSTSMPSSTMSPSPSSADVAPPARTASTAAEAVQAVYTAAANNIPTVGCAMFAPEAAQQFAASVGATDCATAVGVLANRAANPSTYRNTMVNSDNVVPRGETEAEVSSCRLAVSGGPRLGLFRLSQRVGGWVITGYQPEPAVCPRG